MGNETESRKTRTHLTILMILGCFLTRTLTAVPASAREPGALNPTMARDVDVIDWYASEARALPPEVLPVDLDRAIVALRRGQAYTHTFTSPSGARRITVVYRLDVGSRVPHVMATATVDESGVTFDVLPFLLFDLADGGTAIVGHGSLFEEAASEGPLRYQLAFYEPDGRQYRPELEIGLGTWRSSCFLDGGGTFVVGLPGTIVAFDTGKGTLRWRHDLQDGGWPKVSANPAGSRLAALIRKPADAWTIELLDSGGTALGKSALHGRPAALRALFDQSGEHVFIPCSRSDSGETATTLELRSASDLSVQRIVRLP
ncbi:MAG TPA: hypothetical protein VF720_16625 [Candidatus Eisenbacteria bacterium]